MPPYAFDPRFASFGTYRPLVNVYSDGTTYPLDMSKYDFYGSAGTGPATPGAPGAAPGAPGAPPAKP